MSHRSFAGRELCLGFVAGAAAAVLVSRLLVELRSLSVAPSKVKGKCSYPQSDRTFYLLLTLGVPTAVSRVISFLDSRDWTQKSREVTDDQLSKADVLSASKHSLKKVLRIDSKTVVKLAPDLDMNEVDNLGFVRSNTTLPVPKILNAYEKGGFRYILM
jgi:hypothetical protein